MLRSLVSVDAAQAFLEGQRTRLDDRRFSTGADLRFVMLVLNMSFRLIHAVNPTRIAFDTRRCCAMGEPFVLRSTFKFAVGTTF